MVRFCFAFIFVVSFLSVVNAWELGEELGLKVDVPSLRYLPCVPVTEHIYILVLPENIPSEASSQHLGKGHLFGNKLSGICGESGCKSFGILHLHPLPSREANLAVPMAQFKYDKQAAMNRQT